jgi:hypothetical protein
MRTVAHGQAQGAASLHTTGSLPPRSGIAAPAVAATACRCRRHQPRHQPVAVFAHEALAGGFAGAAAGQARAAFAI